MARLAILTALVAGAILTGTIQMAEHYHVSTPSFMYEIVIFFSVSNIVLYSVITRFLKGRPQDFVRVYLGATVLRILFFGAFAFVLMMLDRSGARVNTILFLISYLLFTILEVWMVYRQTIAQN